MKSRADIPGKRRGAFPSYSRVLNEVEMVDEQNAIYIWEKAILIFNSKKIATKKGQQNTINIYKFVLFLIIMQHELEDGRVIFTLKAKKAFPVIETKPNQTRKSLPAMLH